MIERELVKPVQTRKGKGWSAVHRTSGAPWGLSDRHVYVKTQQDYNCRPAWRLWRLTPTFLRESRALQACNGLGMSIPRLVSCRTEQGITEVVLEEIPDAMPLDMFCDEAAQSRQDSVMYDLGRMVGLMHSSGWVHGAIAPDHVLVQSKDHDKVWLIDFEKARRAVRKGRIDADLERLWRRAPFLSNSCIEAFFSGYRQSRPQGWHQALANAERIKQAAFDHSNQ